MEHQIELTTSDGVRLAALTQRVDDGRRWAVLCHPHPDFGGSMHVALLGELVDRLGVDGISTLRFDFRRPGTEAERLLDVEAALSHTGADILVGWSYGADLALATAAAHPRIARVAAVAAPLRAFRPEPTLADRALFLVPEADQFNPPPAVRERLPWARVEVIEGADHFLAGHEGGIADRVVAFVRDP